MAVNRFGQISHTDNFCMRQNLGDFSVGVFEHHITQGQGQQKYCQGTSACLDQRALHARDALCQVGLQGFVQTLAQLKSGVDGFAKQANHVGMARDAVVIQVFGRLFFHPGRDAVNSLVNGVNLCARVSGNCTARSG